MTALYDWATGRIKLPEDAPPSAWVVMGVMLEALNHGTRETWLAVDTIAIRSGINWRTVQRDRAYLVEQGLLIPVESNRKSQVFTIGWKPSGRKKQAHLITDVKPVPGLGRSTVIRLCTLWKYGVRKTADLVRKTGLSLRSVRRWRVTYVTPVGRVTQTTPVQETQPPTSVVTSSSSPTEKRKPTARQSRMLRLRKAVARMPYEVFKDLEMYADSERLTGLVERAARRSVKEARAARPVEEWAVRDVIDEFRAQYREKYPNHSPDELGNYVTLLKILGKLRKDEGVTVVHMHAAIDDFYRQRLDFYHPDSPAWKKWLWCVRDTRPKDGTFLKQQTEQAVVPKKATPVVDLDAQIGRLRSELAVAQADLDRYLSVLDSSPDEMVVHFGRDWSTRLIFARDLVEHRRKRLVQAEEEAR